MNNNFVSLDHINIINKNPNKVDMDLSKQDNVLNEFEELLKSFSNEDLTLEVIEIESNEDYYKYQHIFLNKGYISIFKDENYLYIGTRYKKIFLFDVTLISQRAVNLIFKVHSPRKIIFNSIDFFKENKLSTNSSYDVLHVVRMFYNEKPKNLISLVNLFITDSIDNINEALYYVLDIVKKINVIIEKNSLFSLVNQEFKVLDIIRNTELLGLPMKRTEYEDMKALSEKEYSKCKEYFEVSYESDYDDYYSIIEGFKRKKDIKVFNEDYFSSKKDFFNHNLVVAKLFYNDTHNDYIKHYDERLYVRYDPCFEYMSVMPSMKLMKGYEKFFEIDNSKIYVTASYKNLFFRIFADVSKIPYLITYAKGDTKKENKIISKLSQRVFKEVELDNITKEFYASAVLSAIIRGYFEPSETKLYFENELGVIMDEKEIAKYINLFYENAKEIISFVKEFDFNYSKGKRRTFVDNMPIYNYIKLTETDILKDALVLAQERIESFNNRNKYQIKFVHIGKNSFVLEADEEAFNTAFDISNRTLTDIHNKYISNVPALCNVLTKPNGIKVAN